MFGGLGGRSLVVGLASVAVGVGVPADGDRGSCKPDGRTVRPAYARVEISRGDDDRGRWSDRWSDRRRDYDRCEEEMPCDLVVRAYRVDSEILLVVRGSNRTGGFHTELRRERCGTLRLINRAPRDRCALQAVTPFEIAATLCGASRQSRLTLTVAGREIEVCVSKVNEL